jgi:hypothetical protein
MMALLSFCYLFGWELGLLLSTVIVVHEAGHVAAMLMVGVGVWHLPHSLLWWCRRPQDSLSDGGPTRLRRADGARFEPHSDAWPLRHLQGDRRHSSTAGSGDVCRHQCRQPVADLSSRWWADPQCAYRLGEPEIGADRSLDRNPDWSRLGHISAIIPDRHSVPAVCAALTSSQTIELERLSFAGGIALPLASITTFVVYVFVINAA